MNFWIKILIKKIIHITPSFKRYVQSISNKYNLGNINDVVNTVSYYKHDNAYLHISDFQNYPLLDKSKIIGKENLFISQVINKRFLFKVSTGGTSGKSLNFHKTLNDIIKEEAYIAYAFSLIGSSLNVGVLRGNKPKNGVSEYRFKTLLLSSYDLTLENVKNYIELINKYKINCLHVYPSSIQVFINYLKILKTEVEIPKLKGILSSSEILSIELKKEILDVFKNVKLVDLYGQNEQVAFAISINLNSYKFYESYSYVELVETGQTFNDNKICEIVGTNIHNKAMPLIRYRTEDFVEIDHDGNIVSIIGRTTDFIVNKHNEIVPCIVLTRPNTLLNVISFQYFQDKVGYLVFRVKVNEFFNNNDEQNIVDDLSKCFNNLMCVKVEVVKEIERTKNGKQQRLIQMLNVKL